MAICMTVLAAKGVIIDQQAGQTSAFSIFEELTAQTFPLLIPEMAAFALWHRDNPETGEEFTTTVRVLNNDAELIKAELKQDLLTTRTSRSLLTLSPLVVPTPGTLSFEFLVEGVVKGRFLFYVNAAPPIVNVS